MLKDKPEILTKPKLWSCANRNRMTFLFTLMALPRCSISQPHDRPFEIVSRCTYSGSKTSGVLLVCIDDKRVVWVQGIAVLYVQRCIFKSSADAS